MLFIFTDLTLRKQ